MIKRLVALLALAVTTLLLVAPAAQARDLDPGEAEWVITTSDLTSATGKVKEQMTNALGPTIPTGCALLDSGKTANGRNSLSTIFGELTYRNGATWQSTVWTYRTSTAAKASFATLQSQSLAVCNHAFEGLIGDDGADMPAVVVDRARKVPGGTQPRFTVADSQILTDPANARPGYANSFRYAVFTLVDDAIVQVNLFQKDPISGAQRADAGRAATAVATRYAASF